MELHRFIEINNNKENNTSFTKSPGIAVEKGYEINEEKSSFVPRYNEEDEFETADRFTWVVKDLTTLVGTGVVQRSDNFILKGEEWYLEAHFKKDKTTTFNLYIVVDPELCYEGWNVLLRAQISIMNHEDPASPINRKFTATMNKRQKRWGWQHFKPLTLLAKYPDNKRNKKYFDANGDVHIVAKLYTVPQVIETKEKDATELISSGKVSFVGPEWGTLYNSSSNDVVVTLDVSFIVTNPPEHARRWGDMWIVNIKRKEEKIGRVHLGDPARVKDMFSRLGMPSATNIDKESIVMTIVGCQKIVCVPAKKQSERWIEILAAEEREKRAASEEVARKRRAKERERQAASNEAARQFFKKIREEEKFWFRIQIAVTGVVSILVCAFILWEAVWIGLTIWSSYRSTHHGLFPWALGITLLPFGICVCMFCCWILGSEDKCARDCRDDINRCFI